MATRRNKGHSSDLVPAVVGPRLWCQELLEGFGHLVLLSVFGWGEVVEV